MTLTARQSKTDCQSFERLTTMVTELLTTDPFVMAEREGDV